MLAREVVAWRPPMARCGQARHPAGRRAHRQGRDRARARRRARRRAPAARGRSRALEAEEEDERRSRSKAAALERCWTSIGEVAVAVSGGVDSMTLAVAAGRRLGDRAEMLHAVSPAVPPEASARVEAYARREGWRSRSSTPASSPTPTTSRTRPTAASSARPTSTARSRRAPRRRSCSGTNLDDLGDWRPGLRRPRRTAYATPMSRRASTRRRVRALARGLASTTWPSCRRRHACPAGSRPASRYAERLRLVHAVERLISRELTPRTVRCRLFHDGVAIQLDPEGLERIEGASAAPLRRTIEQMAGAQPGALRALPDGQRLPAHRRRWR